MTSNKEQAIQFSQKVVLRESKKRLPAGTATVCQYEIDLDDAESQLEILRFNEPSSDWFDYVVNNRLGLDLFPQCDIVIGPVANDDVYRVIEFFESGMYTKEFAIDALKVKKLFNQYTVKTGAALGLLKFISCETFGERD